MTAGRAAQWVTLHAAAEVLGCSRQHVQTLARAGRLEQRKVARKHPSINLESVHRLARELEEERVRREGAREAEAAARALRGKPPQDGQVWLSLDSVALMLGVTRNRVDQLTLAGRIPHTKHGGRVWIRRTDAEIVAAARAFRARMTE